MINDEGMQSSWLKECKKRRINKNDEGMQKRRLNKILHRLLSSQHIEWMHPTRDNEKQSSTNYNATKGGVNWKQWTTSKIHCDLPK